MKEVTKSWKRRKLSYLEFFYGDNYNEWKDMDYLDDRYLYCNMYEQIEEALNTLDDNPVSFVRVAMNNHIDEQEIILDRIIDKFKPL